jgi:hypothetical protein
MTQEALASLKALSHELRLQLLELPEYRALSVVERTIQELSEILRPVASASVEAATPENAPSVEALSHTAVVEFVPVEPQVAAASVRESRMAKAIAETIAARAAALQMASSATPALRRALSAAS